MTTQPRSASKRPGWRAALQDAGDRLLDRILGIETWGIVSNDDLGFTTDVGNPHQTSNWVNLLGLERLLRGWRVSGQDVFIDVGCGRGQVLALAVRHPFGRVIGLDLSEELLAVARRNMDRLERRRRCGSVELVHGDALEYEIPRDLTVCYFYMPLPTAVYERFVARLAASAEQHPRTIRIIYLEEAAEDRAVPGRHGFRKVAQHRRMAIYTNESPVTPDRDASAGPTHKRGAVGSAMERIRRRSRTTGRDLAKRLFDLVAAGAALVVLSPLILAIAVAVRVRLGSPVIFRQQRPGLRGRPFMLYKFRTMHDMIDARGQSIADADRTPPFGRRLRSMSLDELPELWNVIRGDMSLVGPRPLLMQYLERYTPEQMRRHEVRPGITGLAQVGGRNALTWEQKFALDVEYVDHHDLRMDVAILARTVKVVVAREGISHRDDGDGDMPEFMGSGSSSP